MKTVVACCLSGNEYDVDHVYKLYDAIKRNTTHDFAFLVICDDVNYLKLNQKPERITHPFIYWVASGQSTRRWWIKLQLFNKKMLEGWKFAGYDQLLYFDLDTVICGNIDAMFGLTAQFATLRNFLQPPIRNPHVTPCKYGSAVISMNLNRPQPVHIYELYMRDFVNVQTDYSKDGDQYYIEKMYERDAPPFDEAVYLQDVLGENYFRSVKYPESIYYLRELPSDCKVLCYHGDRKPQKETNSDIIQRHWI